MLKSALVPADVEKNGQFPDDQRPPQNGYRPPAEALRSRRADLIAPILTWATQNPALEGQPTHVGGNDRPARAARAYLDLPSLGRIEAASLQIGQAPRSKRAFGLPMNAACSCDQLWATRLQAYNCQHRTAAFRQAGHREFDQAQASKGR